MSTLATTIRHLSWVAVLAVPACGSAAQATEAIGREWSECARPQFAAVMVALDKGLGGYAIEVDGEPYWIAMVERATYVLQLAGTREAIARIKISRPPLADFDEQAGWRERWLQEVAARSAVGMERRMLAGGAELLSVTKDTVAGKYVGVSLIVDRQRKVFAELDWRRMERHASPADVSNLQETVWRQLLPCAFPAVASAGG
ncbi:MAG TPA: hypothetical protein VGD30_08870 [Telluria sp.]